MSGVTGRNTDVNSELDVFLERPREWLDAALSLVLPLRCPICGGTLNDRNRGWCTACESGMLVYDRPVCPQCRRFIPAGASTCETGHDPGDPAVVYAVGGFDNAFGVMVHALKYDGYRELAKPLGQLLADRIGADTFTSVVAIPTSPRKKRKRGYGHAEEIARACANALGISLTLDALQFTRTVADQTKLNAKQRKANLSGALVVRDGLSLGEADVLVIDDVMTTGATMSEAGRALKAAGAKSVTGAIIALNLSKQAGGH